MRAYKIRFPMARWMCFRAGSAVSVRP
ncbi:hypothetical protein [Escherichia coli]